jgi:hypothetical protein
MYLYVPSYVHAQLFVLGAEYYASQYCIANSVVALKLPSGTLVSAARLTNTELQGQR